MPSMIHRFVILPLALALALSACGGSQPPRPAAAAGPADKPSAAFETRWLRGLWANDIRQTVAKVGMACKGPALEGTSSVWTCESGTPLVAYKVRFFGSAPGKIEYINAVVTQSGPAKDAAPLSLFGALAGLHFDGADLPKARTWIAAAMAAGGATTIGPANYRLAGDANRRVLDIKASGSEW